MGCVHLGVSLLWRVLHGAQSLQASDCPSVFSRGLHSSSEMWPPFPWHGAPLCERAPQLCPQQRLLPRGSSAPAMWLLHFSLPRQRPRFPNHAWAGEPRAPPAGWGCGAQRAGRSRFRAVWKRLGVAPSSSWPPPRHQVTSRHPATEILQVLPNATR